MGLLKAVVRTIVEMPIAITKDVLTMGGTFSETSRSATKKTYKEILEELDN